MDSLKVDYKDAAFSGNRKYAQVNNSDSTVSFTDKTTYTTAGDKFGAKDINATNGAVNRMAEVKTVTLPASWSATAPYTLTASVSGILATDAPIISLYLPDGITAANAKAQNKEYGYIDRAVTANGSITFYCYNKKPTVAFQVQIKGA